MRWLLFIPRVISFLWFCIVAPVRVKAERRPAVGLASRGGCAREFDSSVMLLFSCVDGFALGHYDLVYSGLIECSPIPKSACTLLIDFCD